MAVKPKSTAGKKKTPRTSNTAGQKKVGRSPNPAGSKSSSRRSMPKKKPTGRATAAKKVQRTREPMKDRSLDAVSVQLQRIEREIAQLKTERVEGPAKSPDNIETRLKTIDRKFETRLGRLDERIDSLRAHLLDLEERLEGETDELPTRSRDLDDDLDDA